MDQLSGQIQRLLRLGGPARPHGAALRRHLPSAEEALRRTASPGHVIERLPPLRLAGDMVSETRIQIFQGLHKLPLAWDV